MIDVETFGEIITDKMYEIAVNNAPYREPYIVTKKTMVKGADGVEHEHIEQIVKNGGPKGKPGTPNYSPYPGNLKNNGIYRTADGIVFDSARVGYLQNANKHARRHTKNGTNGGPQFIERTNADLLAHLRSIGCNVEKI